jgi:hypothetical protein
MLLEALLERQITLEDAYEYAELLSTQEAQTILKEGLEDEEKF